MLHGEFTAPREKYRRSVPYCLFPSHWLHHIECYLLQNTVACRTQAFSLDPWSALILWRYTLCILCWFSDSRLSHSLKRQLFQLLLRILNAQITSLSPKFVLTLFYLDLAILLTNVYLHRHDNKTLGYFLVDFFLQMTNRCFSNDRLTNINRSGRWDVIHEATTLHAVVEKEIVVRLVLQRNCL